MKEFLIKSIKSQKSKYLTVLLVMILLGAFEFIAVAMYTATPYLNLSFNDLYMVNLIVFVVIILVLMTLLFINHFFNETKKKEFALILLSGRGLNSILYYLTLQYGGLLLIAFIVSIILGMPAILLMNILVTQIFNITLVYNYSELFVLVTSLLGCKFAYLLMINFGIFIRLENEITKLMSDSTYQNKKVDLSAFMPEFLPSENGRAIKKNIYLRGIFHIAVVAVFLYTLVVIFLPYGVDEKIFAVVGCIASLFLILNKSIHYFFEVCHSSIFLKDIKLLIGFSQVLDMLKSLNLVINLSLVLLPTLFSLIVMSSESLELQLYTIVSIMIILIMLFVSLLFKMSLLFDGKQKSINTMSMIGCTPKQINTIKLIDSHVFYLVGVIIPMAICLSLVSAGMTAGSVPLTIGLSVMCCYLACALISYIAMMMMYKKLRIGRK